MYNLSIIKKHLNNILPEILIFFSEEINQKKKITYATTNKATGIISLNCLSTFPNINIDLFNESTNNIIQNKEYSIKLFRFFLHECFSHKKYIYKNNDRRINSPKKSYDQNNNLIMLENVKSGKNNKNIHKISTLETNSGDSGHYLEVFFGRCKYGYIINIMDKCKNLYKLIDNIELFVDDLEILKKYIELKYEMEIKELNLSNNSEKSIIEEINEMEILLKSFTCENENIEKNIEILNKKRIREIKMKKKQKKL